MRSLSRTIRQKVIVSAAAVESRMAQQAGAYAGFCSIKRITPPGWDTGPLQVSFPDTGTHIILQQSCQPPKRAIRYYLNFLSPFFSIFDQNISTFSIFLLLLKLKKTLVNFRTTFKISWENQD
jgi:hypothetical protein